MKGIVTVFHLTLVISEKTVKERKDFTLAEVESLKISVEVGGGKEQEVQRVVDSGGTSDPGQARPTCQLSEKKKGAESERKLTPLYKRTGRNRLCVFPQLAWNSVSSFFPCHSLLCSPGS